MSPKIDEYDVPAWRKLPKMHPRSVIVRKAEKELLKFLLQLEKKHELTLAEYFQVVTNVFSGNLRRLSQMWIRQERHPTDPDKPEDTA